MWIPTKVDLLPSTGELLLFDFVVQLIETESNIGSRLRRTSTCPFQSAVETEINGSWLLSRSSVMGRRRGGSCRKLIDNCMRSSRGIVLILVIISIVLIVAWAGTLRLTRASLLCVVSSVTTLVVARLVLVRIVMFSLMMLTVLVLIAIVSCVVLLVLLSIVFAVSIVLNVVVMRLLLLWSLVRSIVIIVVVIGLRISAPSSLFTTATSV